MAYNNKGIDSNDILKQKATSMEALSSAKKSSESTRKMFGGFSSKVSGDSKARNNKTAIMKEQEVQYQTLARADRGTDSLDPYSFQAPAKLRATEKLALREQGYTNSLLTQIIKNQTNTANLQAEIQYRDSVLNLLKEIRDNTKKEEKKPTNLGPTKGYETKVRQTSDLAQAILGGNPKEMIKQLIKGTDLGSMGFEGYDMLKDSLEMMKEPGMLKQMMKGKIMEAIIGKLPKDIASHANRMREDMATYVQDMINQFAFSKNSTLRSMTRGHYKSVRQDSSSVSKTDMSKEALFDNKFYTAVTMEIPSILYSIRDGINKFVGERYDYDKQEWTTLQAQIKDMAESSQSMTTGVDQLTKYLSNIAEKAVSNTGGITNSYMGQLFQTDKYGSYSKDKNGKFKFQNDMLIRQIITAMVKKGIDTNALQDADPYSIINHFGIKSFVPKEYYDILPNIILGMSDVFKNLSYDERKEFDERREGVANSVDRNYLNNLNKISGYSPQYIDAIYKHQKGLMSSQEFQRATGMSIFRAAAFSGYSQNKDPYKTGHRVAINKGKTTRVKSVQDVNDILSSPVPSIEALANIPTNVWKDLSEDTRATVNSLIGKSTFGMTSSRMVDTLLTNDISSSMKNMTAEQRDKALKQQRLENIKIMINNGGLTDKGLRNRYYNNELTDEDNEKLDKELNKYFKANAIYTKMHSANMTAASMAHYVGMGAKASDYERLGFISDPAQLVPFINDNGELQINQLKAKYSRYNEAMMQGIEREDRRVRMGDDFEISTPITSINRMLTNVFQDAKVTRNMGIIGGAGAGYAIGKLLEQKGIVQSPWLGKMMATVGAVAMSFAKNREKIENILGPAGEFKNEYGITNRQIFMAKFINKWLPSIGLGGKVGSMTMKAFQAMGPLGTLISPFAGLMTGLLAGSIAPTLMRFAQKRLFDNNDESKKGIFKRLGRFLMKFDFVKKYFNIRDKRTDAQIENDITRDMIRNLERDSENLAKRLEDPDITEDERVEIQKRIVENTKRIEELRDFARDLQEIEEDHRATREEKDAAKKRRKDMLEGKNKEAYHLREESERSKRDLSQRNIAMHDMKFITKGDMYKQTRDKTMARMKVDALNAQIERNKDFKEGLSNYLNGNIEDIRDPELLAMFNRFSKGGHNLNDAKIQELMRRYYADRTYMQELKDIEDMDLFIQNEIIDPKTGKPLSGKDVIYKFGKPYLEAALSKHNYERAIRNGKVLLPSEIIRSSDMTAFNNIMQNGDLSPEEKEKAVKKWFDELDEDKRKGLTDALNLRTDVAKGLENLSKTYIRYLSYMNPQMPLDAVTRKAMYDIQETVVLNDFKADLGNIKGIAGDAWDRVIYEKLQSGYIVNDSRSRGESEQLISTLMNMRKAEVGGGSGNGDKSTTQDTQASWRMSDFKDLTFANGKKVSVAGCALGAFNAAITRHGYPPISGQAMLDVANEYLTDDGVNMEFFKAMAVKIGWEVTQYKGSENTFTPQNFKSIASGPKSSVILQLQNIDNDGSHYVTLLQYGNKKCQICDPQAQVYKTEILTGDILARLISVTVLTHPGDSSLKADSDMSKVERFKKNFKERARDAVKSTLKSNGIGMAVYGLYKLGKYIGNRGSSTGLVPTGATNADGTPAVSDESNETQDPIVSKLQEILDKINDFVNVRIIGDDTIALTNTDLESSKTALQMSYQDAKTPKDKNRLHHIRQMFNKPSFQRDQIKKERVEDAILNGALGGTGTAQATQGVTSQVEAAKKTGGGVVDTIKNGLNILGITSLLTKGKALMSKLWGGVKNVASKTWGLVTNGLSKVNAFAQTGLGATLTWTGLAFLQRYLANKATEMTGRKEEEFYAMGEGNDNGDGSMFDKNGKWLDPAKKAERDKAFMSKMTSYVDTPEWYEFVKAHQGDSDYSYRMAKMEFINSEKLNKYPLKVRESFSKPDKKERDLKYLLDRQQALKGEKGGPSDIKPINFGRLRANKVAKFKYGSYPAINGALGLVQNAAAAAFGGNNFGLTMGVGTGLQGDFSKITNGNNDTIAIISKVAQITGVDENLMMAIAGKESGFDANAGARGSSAKGLFQFTSATWKDVTNKHASKIGLTPQDMQRGMGTGQDPRFNPYMNAFMGAFHLADEYKIARQHAGRDPLPEEVYMVHAFGFTGARKYIQASKDAIGIQLETSKSVIDANPYFFYEGGKKRIRPFTVSEMYTWFKNGLISGLDVRNKKSGTAINYAGAFGLSTSGDSIYKPDKIDSTVKYGESIGKTYTGIMNNMPIKGSKNDVVVTSAFGPRNVKGGSNPHRGIDIRAYKGTPIFATHSGKITSNTSNFGIVQITDDKGISTRYLHLSRRTPLKIGEFVKAGQQIGEAGGVGPNGRVDAYGSHLHYEVIDANGNKIDPFKVLDLSYNNLKMTEAENIAYAQRNGLKGATSNMSKSRGEEKGDGPVNQDNRPVQIVNTSDNDKTIGVLIKVMSSLFSGLMKQQAKTTEVLTQILTFMQSESRDNFLINNARSIAKSKY